MHNYLPKDQLNIWHPCTPMKDLETFPPIQINSASGPYIYLTDDKKVIDASSSWWCKNLGHGHPKLKAALIEQALNFEHCLVPNTKNDVLESLGKKLTTLHPHLNKVSFASDGSCVVDMAIKMSLHAQQIQGATQRRQFISLCNSYHGETGLALSVTEIPFFRAPYTPMLMDVVFIDKLPYINTITDPLWDDCSAYWPAIEAQLLKHADQCCAIIVEPIVQAAAGMRLYSKDLLVKIEHFAKAHGIHLIADEIFTGFGRLGRSLACAYANITPDFICLGKGLTGGWLPMSALLTKQSIFDLFYVDYDPKRTFAHSHTYSGNALAAAVAVATLDTLAEENIYQSVTTQGKKWYELMQEVATATGKLEHVRHIGGVVAADLISTPHSSQRLGFSVFKNAVAEGALMRPLGNTIYWTPPLNTPIETMHELKEITIRAIRKTYTQ